MSLNQKSNDTVCAKTISKKTGKSYSTSTNDSHETESNCDSSEEETPGSSDRTIRRFGENIHQGVSLGKGKVNIDKSVSDAKEEASVVDECPAELKTLRYKIMLMNGNTPVEVAPPAKNSYANLQQFLEKEKNNNTKETWSKLNKSVKHKKITEFVTAYTESNELSEEERIRLLEVLKQNMLRGKLAKNKEVNYDKVKGVIKDMPCLVFNKTTRHFTIRNMDAQKHTTTIKKNSYVKISSASNGGGGGGGGSSSAEKGSDEDSA